MKCLQCEKTAWAGQTLCPECLLASKGVERREQPKPIKPKSLFGLEDAVADAPKGCIKCSKPAEPTKVLCAECLGKHPSNSKQGRADRQSNNGRKKRSRFAQFIDLFLRYYLTDRDATYIESRSDFVAGAMPGFFTFVLALFALVLGYKTWSGQHEDPAARNATSASQSSGKDSTTAQGRRSYRQVGADNPSLQIQIVEPKKGSVFKEGESIAFAAVPAQGSSVPARVRFFGVNSQLCEVNSPPFVCSWRPPRIGSYHIRAQAFGSAGQSGPIADTVVQVVTEASFEQLHASERLPVIFIATPTEDTRLILDPSPASTSVYFNGWSREPGKIQRISARLGEQTCSINGVDAFKGVCTVTSPGSHTIAVEATKLDGSTSRAFVAFVAEHGVRGALEGRVNPYYSREELFDLVQDWGRPDPIWETDDSFAESIIPDGEANRIAPIFNDAAIVPEVARFVKMGRLRESSSAGSFDDYVASLSSAVSPPKTTWIAPFGRIEIPLQPRFFGFSGTPPIPAPLERTSIYGAPRFSTRAISLVRFDETGGGHASFLGAPDKNVSLERDVYFLGTLAIAAAGESYSDTLPQQSADSFDGLFTHYLAIAGDKEGENAAITKLVAAGSFLPYETKRILKSSGNYAAMLQWLWRAALPYSDSSGKTLPFSHEVRHRAAYVARGDENVAGLSAAQPYHRYDEVLHMREMARLASNLRGTLPPVTMLSLVDYSVRKGDEVVVTPSNWDDSRQRIKLMLPTVARVWGEEGETIQMRIDLSSSYDIFGKQLRFAVKPLYPEHRALVSVSQESSSQFLVSVHFDSRFPRARIPVIATASNDAFEGVPAFINFLWPEPKLREVGVPKPFDAQIPEAHANRNKRPIVTSHTPQGLVARVGAIVRIPLSCTDPEGFETTWLRWDKEPGAIKDSVYTFPVTSEYAGRNLTLHFICSDGTGAYGGLERTLRIE